MPLQLRNSCISNSYLSDWLRDRVHWQGILLCCEARENRRYSPVFEVSAQIIELIEELLYFSHRATQIPKGPKRPSDNRKKRGHMSAGHGRIGKHRKHPGGRGNPGRMHHHWILFDKYHPGYFGNVGMRYFHKLRNKFHCPIANIDKLRSLIPQELEKSNNETSDASKDNVPMIDVTQYGYFKVLGKGAMPENKPIVVKAKLVSKIAENKIKENGGAVVLTA
ncbi:60S ribosomal protein L27a-2 [Hevea brasiliensis]|uniref:60S ribosomal protein L27a-2 n=1 Tax=Hevea brasiliensis TaxID=3981 RepID=UPI0025DF475E|nr:60S ribosomal protein L27a-2 [Hevea brasiliensis]